MSQRTEHQDSGTLRKVPLYNEQGNNLELLQSSKVPEAVGQESAPKIVGADEDISQYRRGTVRDDSSLRNSHSGGQVASQEYSHRYEAPKDSSAAGKQLGERYVKPKLNLNTTGSSAIATQNSEQKMPKPRRKPSQAMAQASRPCSVHSYESFPAYVEPSLSAAEESLRKLSQRKAKPSGHVAPDDVLFPGSATSTHETPGSEPSSTFPELQPPNDSEPAPAPSKTKYTLWPPAQKGDDPNEGKVIVGRRATELPRKRKPSLLDRILGRNPVDPKYPNKK